jgi:hypothetical protein
VVQVFPQPVLQSAPHTILHAPAHVVVQL